MRRLLALPLVAVVVVAVVVAVLPRQEAPKDPWEQAEKLGREILDALPVDEPVPALDPDALVRALVAANARELEPVLEAHVPLRREGRTLHAFFDAYVARVTSADPDLGLWLGAHPHPAGVSSLVPRDRLARALVDRDALRAVLAWQPGDAHERTDVAILRGWLELSLEPGGPTDDDRLEWLTGWAELLVGLETIACCPEVARVASIAARLEAAPARIEEALATIDRPSRASVEAAARRLEDVARYVETFERGSLAERARRAAAALRRAREHLLAKVLPRADGALGVGRARLDGILARAWHVPYGARGLLARALDVLADSRAGLATRMEAITKLPAWPDPPPRGPKDVAQLQGWTEEWVARGPRPDAGIVVTPVPKLWAHYRAGGMYLGVGPLAEARTRAHFLEYPWPGGEHDFTRRLAGYQWRHVLAHEAYPGHHLEHLLGLESACAVRRVADNSLFREGWATYAVDLLHETGRCQPDAFDDYARELDRFGAAHDALFEVAVHARALPPERLLAWLRGYGRDPGLSLADLGEAARGAGRRSIYLVGHEAMRALRDRTRERLGPAFRAPAFHERVLRGGPVPFELLERELESE